MSTTSHPLAQLSAYLDAALAPAERGAVEAHLASCPDCRARLAELRSTAALIRGLPDLAPSRRLTPRVARAPSWLAPLRTLSTLASGVSVFLFIATALLSNVSQLAATSAPAAPAPAAAGGAAAATASSAEQRSISGATPSGAPAPAFGAPAGAATAGPTAANLDSAKQATTSTPRPGQEFAAASPSSDLSLNATREQQQRVAQGGGPSLTSPWVWLLMAIVTGAIALALQRRLRSV
jgi:anti-sigma factor RsiW